MHHILDGAGCRCACGWRGSGAHHGALPAAPHLVRPSGRGAVTVSWRVRPMVTQGRELHGPGPGCSDDRDCPAEEVAAQLRTSFCEAAVDEADRSRVVTRFKSIFQPSGQNRGERGVETVCPFFAEGLGGLARW
ncbi:hypothetical protein Nm8I071_40030 [Nonomuraea sp. TT08I-71]|nr:hypothetical protein Nm8I071_40030 [Nonomuraea sp. TT08I-71]